MQNKLLTLYQNVLNDLIFKIESNELKINAKLPSEQQLGVKYGVSRITIRRALQELETRGYIVKKQGLGSFVADTVADIEMFQNIDIEMAINKMNLTAKVKLISFDLIADGKTFDRERKLLNLSADEYFYHMKYGYYGDGELMAVQKLTLNFNYFPLIKVSEVKDKVAYPMLAKKYGFQQINFLQETSSGVVSKHDRTKLEIKSGSPFVRIEKKGIVDNQIVLFDEMFLIESLPMYLINN